ncbi:unnamed protein product [Brachionus calyciflorus]|uniref:Cathepsin propeptide inhibitor domain-containing protein n=1 Tax=Brachionus calyciflorus TaxID=104777 RepID=A0A813N348_9BILA|nr:unnamed protein product [Brachionus calyciflorus]
MKNFLFKLSMLCLILLKTLKADQFDDFVKKYGKKYENKMLEEYRRSVFYDNLKLIQEHNKRYEQKLETYFLSVNKFADLTFDELMVKSHGRIKLFNTIFKSSPRRTPIFLRTSVPKRIDWRKRGLVTEVRDQGDCG